MSRYSESLIHWFMHVKRSLPWRDNPTPYSVLVSEVMLQQTQADRVIGYFNRWMNRFPNIVALAEAEIEEVMKLWEGLGYYSRARALHKAAQYIVNELSGKIPDSKDELLKIPGVGPYTSGAILSFAFKKKAVALDANVFRVISRFHMYPKRLEETKAREELENLTFDFLPDNSSEIVMESLIELGALICTKIPKCALCPLQGNCASYKNDLVDKFPIKKEPLKRIDLYRIVFILRDKQEVYIIKRPQGVIMSGLHEFPYIEIPFKTSEEEMKASIYEQFPSANIIASLPMLQHSFTRYRAFLFPFLIESSEINEITSTQGGFWKNLSDVGEMSFSSGHKRILDILKNRQQLK